MKNNKLITILIIIFLILLGFVSYLIYTLQQKSEKANTSSVEKIIDNTKNQINNTNGILGVNPDNFVNQNPETLSNSLNNVLTQTESNTIQNNSNNQQTTSNTNSINNLNIDIDSISKLDTVTTLNSSKITASDSEIYNYVISTMTDGKKVLLVPLDKLNSQPFKDFVKENSKILDPKITNSDTRLFLYDEKTMKLEYIDSQIYYLTDFIYQNKTYWVSLAYRKLVLSSPYFKDKININYSGTGLITELRQDTTSRNKFYATAVTGLNDYKFFILDFSRSIDNPELNIIVNN